MASHPFAACVVFVTVRVLESITTVVMNTITIMVFLQERQLRRRSTYLLTNLAVADLFVGAVSGPYDLVAGVGVSCQLWNDHGVFHNDFLRATALLFFLASFTNLTFISFERLHATLYPFGHRVAKNWIYWMACALSWIVAAVTASFLTVLQRQSFMNYFYLWSSFNSVALFVIFSCYFAIFVEVRCKDRPRHHTAANREKKMTVTLFVITAVSILISLPWLVFSFLLAATGLFNELSHNTYFSLTNILYILILSNSFVNPVLYAARMPVFKRTAYQILCRRAGRRNEVHPLQC